MNDLIFSYLFSLSKISFIANSAVFVSDVLIYILLIVLLFFILFYKKPIIWSGALIFTTGVSAWVISKFLKLVFRIPRPFVEFGFDPVVHESGFSMPSSHAMFFCAITVIVFSMNKYLGVLFSVCTFLIAISRVVLGVHYPFDVFIGSVLGTIIGLIFLRIGKSKKLVAFLSKTL